MNVGADKLRKSVVQFFKGRADLHMVRMFVMRTTHDFDPLSGEYWRVPPTEIPKIFTQRIPDIDFVGGLQEAQNQLYDDIFDVLPETLKASVSASIAVGTPSRLVKIDKGDGIGLCWVLMDIYTIH